MKDVTGSFTLRVNGDRHVGRQAHTCAVAPACLELFHIVNMCRGQTRRANQDVEHHQDKADKLANAA